MYKAFFGLRAKPFRLNPDPRFLFASRGAKRAMDFLKFGLYQREGLVLLTGASGVGKSLLLRNLLAQLPAEQAAVAQIQPILGDAGAVLRQVAAAFGVTAERDDPSPLAALQRQLLVEAQAGRRALLFVDEAQNLDAGGIELLRLLSNLQIGAASTLQVFLIARPEFRRRIAGPAFESLRQRIVAADHLDALDLDEVGPYIAWRMQRAGWAHAPLFDDAAIEAITASTAAVARRINTLCDRLLMQAFVEGRTTIRGEDIAPVVDEMAGEWSIDLAGPAAADAAALRRRASDLASTGDAADGSPRAAAAGRAAAADLSTTLHPEPLVVALDDELGTDDRLLTLESRMAALEASTAQVAKVSRAILGRIDAGKPV